MAGCLAGGDLPPGSIPPGRPGRQREQVPGGGPTPQRMGAVVRCLLDRGQARLEPSIDQRRRRRLPSAIQWASPSASLPGPFGSSKAKQYGPANARPWRPFFVAAAQAARGTASPVQEALEQLNFAELAFWEEKVVPVRVKEVHVAAEGGQRKEEIEIEQLLDDKEFPPNSPIRQPHPPDFATILEDKNLTRTRVELSDTPDLWDRERQQARPVEAQWQIRVDTLADRLGGPLRALRLVRTLAADEEPTPVGFRGYFKTSDQPWQMGLFLRRRQALESLPRHAILADIFAIPSAASERSSPCP